MINLDYITLRKFYEENVDFLIGARLQKIQQPTRKDLIFHLRNLGESKKLYININPQIYHISFMSTESEAKRNLIIPKQPPMFCMLLRKYLEGAKISDAGVIDGERIFELHFEITDEYSQSRLLCLSFELMGKHSNVILYDRESNVIIGCAHNVGPEKSRYRELQGGLKYTYPLSSDLSKFTREPLYTILNNNKSLNDELDDYFSKIQEEIVLKSEKDKLYQIAQNKLKKSKSSIEKISVLLKKRDKTEEYKLYGELLTANLYQNKDYSSKITLLNYFTGKEVDIDLDSTKTLKENAQRYFRLYNKSKATKEKSDEMLQALLVDKEYAENIIYSIDQAKNLTDLIEIKTELNIEILEFNKNKKIPNKILENILRFSINEYEVFIGKNNKQNDYIISKLAKDEDYWFHTKTCAGSHVLLKIKNKEPDDKTLLECAKLAREYSSAKLPSKVAVVYTKCKYIKKPPKSPLGYVIYKNEQEILI